MELHKAESGEVDRLIGKQRWLRDLIAGSRVPEHRWYWLPTGKINILPNSKYETASTVIDRGTLFFAYTDGLTDALNLDGKAFDIETLLPIFTSGQELYSLCDRVHGEIEEFSRGLKQFDDITMLVVKRS